MFILITMELKRRIKKPMTWFLILILTLMSLINIMETKEARSYRIFTGHDIHRFSDFIPNWVGLDERHRQLMPKAVFSREVLTKVQVDIVIANKQEDVREVTRLLAFLHLLQAKAGFVTNDTIGNPEFDRLVKPMWYDVSGGIPYDNINFFPLGGAFIDTRQYHLLRGKYYHHLYVNDLEPIYHDDLNNVTYLYDYFFNIVPLFVIILSILLVYNSINKEKNSGSLKLVITQSINRWKYYISKWIAGTVHVLFIILLPPIVLSTILGIRYGFVSLSYPTIYLRNSMTSLKTIPNYFDAVDFIPRFRPTFSYMAPNTTSRLFMPHERMELIPFYQYLLLVLLLTIMFVAFAVALTQLISALINIEIISFVTIAGIFIAGTLLSTPFTQGKSLNLSPFTMGNPGRIIIGTYNITALGAIITLLASTALLLAIGCRYFRTKEI